MILWSLSQSSNHPINGLHDISRCVDVLATWAWSRAHLYPATPVLLLPTVPAHLLQQPPMCCEGKVGMLAFLAAPNVSCEMDSMPLYPDQLCPDTIPACLKEEGQHMPAEWGVGSYSVPGNQMHEAPEPTSFSIAKDWSSKAILLPMHLVILDAAAWCPPHINATFPNLCPPWLPAPELAALILGPKTRNQLYSFYMVLYVRTRHLTSQGLRPHLAVCTQIQLYPGMPHCLPPWSCSTHLYQHL